MDGERKGKEYSVAIYQGVDALKASEALEYMAELRRVLNTSRYQSKESKEPVQIAEARANLEEATRRAKECYDLVSSGEAKWWGETDKRARAKAVQMFCLENKLICVVTKTPPPRPVKFPNIKF